MIDIIKNALKEAEIKTWRINEKKEHTAEVFFIRRRQDMRRIRDTHKYNVEVFCDYEKDGKPMRGRSQVTIVPSQSEQEVLTLLKEAKHAASFAGNPYYELPEKQACEPIAAAGSLAEVSAEEAAKRFAAAAHRNSDCRSRMHDKLQHPRVPCTERRIRRQHRFYNSKRPFRYRRGYGF